MRDIKTGLIEICAAVFLVLSIVNAMVLGNVQDGIYEAVAACGFFLASLCVSADGSAK